jgi:hypothetical protein
MKRALSLFALVALSLAATPPVPSGAVGIFGIIERVAFEPNDRAPDRIKVWGAFAYVDGGTSGFTISPAKRGFLYFKLSSRSLDSTTIRPTRAEWNDLKAVAGTGQAVGFGQWYYIGQFGGLHPDAWYGSAPFIHALERAPSGRVSNDLRVRSPADTALGPVSYDTNVGVVKITEASHGAIIRVLREALRK